MIALLSLLTLSPAHADTTAEVGKPAPDFTLTDLEGKEVKLSALKGKPVVLEWFNPGCPYVQYAHGEGPLGTMASEWTAKDVQWLAINSGSPGKQGHGLEVNKQAAADWKLSHPILLDESGTVGKLYGAKTTPQMVVIDAEGVIRYAGALDNAPFGKAEGKHVDYVGDAIGAVLEGGEVQPDHTKSYGCSVKY